MKKQSKENQKNIFKKLFIKICRIFGYEIIDQNNFFIPTQEKSINENLSLPGKKSITLPLGVVKISRKVTSLTTIFRSCTNVNMLTQNKKRIFEEKKSEYTLRSLNSIVKSLKNAKKDFPLVSFEIIIVDYNSPKNDQDKMKKLISIPEVKSSLINLNINDFKTKIKKTNAKNQNVTDNQMSNMSNIYKSLLLAKDYCKDLIYFVEDDYLHQEDAVTEMIFTYERISSQMNRELILCPADYPYLYTEIKPSKILVGSKKHWRTVNETLCTFLTSSDIVNKYWEKLISMCEFEHYPFEQPLHDIYQKEYCLSPIPSVALHCTNVNSIFGLSPNMEWEKIWENNKI